MGAFSERNGYDRSEAEITIRADAPPAAREARVMGCYRLGWKPSEMRATSGSFSAESQIPETVL